MFLSVFSWWSSINLYFHHTPGIQTSTFSCQLDGSTCKFHKHFTVNQSKIKFLNFTQLSQLVLSILLSGQYPPPFAYNCMSKSWHVFDSSFFFICLSPSSLFPSVQMLIIPIIMQLSIKWPCPQPKPEECQSDLSKWKQTHTTPLLKTLHWVLISSVGN